MAKIEMAATRLTVPRGKCIVTAGTVCRHVYFVAGGAVRAFCYAKGREITFWIGEEGSVALSMQSYIDGTAGYESIVTLEDSILYRISVDALHSLYSSDLSIANWGRKFAEKEILRAEQALIP
ncbi:MAG: cyclic nucleotide-binding domain-containing protein [Bacteroides sp.]|nr:cyclic nucleotide-binding domain-containing protein [Bacteroides sp.]MCM1095004.1 cyclic nucleotide-binding domain-containing protein [Terasakiella sp.]